MVGHAHHNPRRVQQHGFTGEYDNRVNRRVLKKGAGRYMDT